MSQDFWDEVQKVYAAAAEAPLEARAQLLDARCGDRAELRAEVESLLASNDRAAGFLETDSLGDLSAPPEESGPDPAVGQVVGGFRLIDRLGQGGMGVVYSAARADDEFHQRVAVKLIATSLFDTAALRRFRAERQILAALNHPHIVTLLDGGMTGTGQAYLAMELVDGIPITRFVGSQPTPLDARVRLLQQVCEAVQHAHQRSVIHRDLKPANILVTPDGVPKILDFGIAKLLDGSERGAHRTVTGMWQPLTPNYASPE